MSDNEFSLEGFAVVDAWSDNDEGRDSPRRPTKGEINEFVERLKDAERKSIRGKRSRSKSPISRRLRDSPSRFDKPRRNSHHRNSRTRVVRSPQRWTHRRSRSPRRKRSHSLTRSRKSTRRRSQSPINNSQPSASNFSQEPNSNTSQFDPSPAPFPDNYYQPLVYHPPPIPPPQVPYLPNPTYYPPVPAPAPQESYYYYNSYPVPPVPQYPQEVVSTPYESSFPPQEAYPPGSQPSMGGLSGFPPTQPFLPVPEPYRTTVTLPVLTGNVLEPTNSTHTTRTPSTPPPPVLSGCEEIKPFEVCAAKMAVSLEIKRQKERKRAEKELMSEFQQLLQNSDVKLSTLLKAVAKPESNSSSTRKERVGTVTRVYDHKKPSQGYFVPDFGTVVKPKHQSPVVFWNYLLNWNKPEKPKREWRALNRCCVSPTRGLSSVRVKEETPETSNRPAENPLGRPEEASWSQTQIPVFPSEELLTPIIGFDPRGTGTENFESFHPQSSNFGAPYPQPVWDAQPSYLTESYYTQSAPTVPVNMSQPRSYLVQVETQDVAKTSRESKAKKKERKADLKNNSARSSLVNVVIQPRQQQRKAGIPSTRVRLSRKCTAGLKPAIVKEVKVTVPVLQIKEAERSFVEKPIEPGPSQPRIRVKLNRKEVKNLDEEKVPDDVELVMKSDLVEEISTVAQVKLPLKSNTRDLKDEVLPPNAPTDEELKQNDSILATQVSPIEREETNSRDEIKVCDSNATETQVKQLGGETQKENENKNNETNTTTKDSSGSGGSERLGPILFKKFRELQLNHEMSRELLNTITADKTRKHPEFMTRGGMLCRKYKTGSSASCKIFIPPSCVNQFVSVLHTLSNPHTPMPRLSATLERYFSPVNNAEAIIKKILDECDECRSKL